MSFILLNAEDYSLPELLDVAMHGGEFPEASVLDKAESEPVASHRAANLVEAAVARGRTVTDRNGVAVRPHRRENGRFLRKVLVVEDRADGERPKLFPEKLVGKKYPYHVLCKRWPRCANPAEPFQSPYGKGSSPVEMCAACRKVVGKSPRFKEVIAARNREMGLKRRKEKLA